MRAHYTIQCVHPDTGKTGCWIFSGDDHRKIGTSLSPVFSDLTGLYRWFAANGWQHVQSSVLDCEKTSTKETYVKS
jgi:hypothetical protein